MSYESASGSPSRIFVSGEPQPDSSAPEARRLSTASMHSGAFSVVKRHEVYNDRLSTEVADAILVKYFESHVTPQPAGADLFKLIKHEILRLFCRIGASELTTFKGQEKREFRVDIRDQAGQIVTYTVDLDDLYQTEHTGNVDLSTFLRSYTQDCIPIISQFKNTGLWYSFINPFDIKNSEQRLWALQRSATVLRDTPGSRSQTQRVIAAQFEQSTGNYSGPNA